MDCRTFHQKLEDYLEDGLDFSGRFGMERHYQQCISCGKALADARRLRQMTSELHRVKAPVNFESSISREIANRKAHSRFWGIRRYWIYGFEWPSLRKMAFASTMLIVLGFGIFYASHRATLDRVSIPSRIINEPAKVAVEEKESRDSKIEVDVRASAHVPKKPITAEAPKLAKKAPIPPTPMEKEQPTDLDKLRMDYVEYMMMGPDNHAVPVRLPRRIPMRYNQMSEEYFIRNVSH